MATFRVRSMTKVDAQWMWDKAVELGWELAYGDPEALWAVDETGYFVGELDGEIISCVGCLKYSNTFAFVAMYMVDEQYRGQGYGLKTFNVAIRSIPRGCNIGLVTFPDLEAMYQKSGFKVHWKLYYTTFRIAQLASIECPPRNDFNIKSISSNMFTVLGDPITKYDCKCFFTARPQLIKEAIFSTKKEKQRDQFVVLDKNSGEVTGLIVVRQLISDEVLSYQVGPFYADSIEIATCLLNHTCNFLINKGLAKQQISITYPECNMNASALADKLKATIEQPVSTMVYMFTGIPPPYSVEHVYSISSPGIG